MNEKNKNHLTLDFFFQIRINIDEWLPMESQYEQLQDIYIIYFIKLYWQHGNKQKGQNK